MGTEDEEEDEDEEEEEEAEDKEESVLLAVAELLLVVMAEVLVVALHPALAEAADFDASLFGLAAPAVVVVVAESAAGAVETRLGVRPVPDEEEKEDEEEEEEEDEEDEQEALRLAAGRESAFFRLWLGGAADVDGKAPREEEDVPLFLVAEAALALPPLPLLLP